MRSNSFPHCYWRIEITIIGYHAFRPKTDCFRHSGRGLSFSVPTDRKPIFSSPSLDSPHSSCAIFVVFFSPTTIFVANEGHLQSEGPVTSEKSNGLKKPGRSSPFSKYPVFMRHPV